MGAGSRCIETGVLGRQWLDWRFPGMIGIAAGIVESARGSFFIIFLRESATDGGDFLFIWVKGGKGMEDEEILALLRSRDERGLYELGNKYGKRLAALAERILPAQDAAECVNDTYLAVWESIPPKCPEFLFAYTAKICRNLAFNRVEWNHAAKRNAVFVELSDELGKCAPDVSEKVWQQELTRAIADFLWGQEEEKRQIFIRRYWYGDSVKELAEAFGCRQGKIKSILFRQRKQLWNALKKEGMV